MKGSRPVAMVIVCLLIVLGYYFVLGAWVIRYSMVRHDAHIIFGVLLWLLVVSGGVITGSLGFGSRLDRVLAGKDALLWGILIFLTGAVLMLLTIDRQSHAGYIAGGCEFFTSQLASATAYPVIVSAFGAYLASLGRYLTRQKELEGPRRSPNMTAFAVVVVLVVIANAANLSTHFIYAREPSDPCCLCPDVEMFQRNRPSGYELEVYTSRTEPLYFFRVTAFTNGTEWTGFPKTLEPFTLGRGPLGGYLNFTDITWDGRLSNGDFFTLESLESGSQYEIILIWAANDNKIGSHVIRVP